MKAILKTISVSFLAGLAGAYSLHAWQQPDEPVFNYSPNNQMNAPGASYASQSASVYSNMAAMNADFVQASAASTQSVVYIKTVSAQEQVSWFDFYFHGQQGKSVGSGSGVIFTADGYVVTNNHVIERAENIEVIHEKRAYKAKIIGTDPSTDIAVLKIDGKNLPAIRLGDSKKVNVGEWVLAVGNPFNLNSTVTAGIVSAKGRNLNIVSSQFPIESFIQTDAAINPGNSGGALVNTRGELIGINTAIYSQTGSYAGYGFAVPSDIVAKIVADLIKYGEVQKAFFGGEISDINQQVAEQYKLSDLSGVLLSYVQQGSAADDAGLRKGDVLVRINEEPLNSKANFDEEISYRNPGEKIKVVFKRNNKLQETMLTLTNREGTTGILKREVYASAELGGAELENVSKVLRDKYNIEGGVRIVKTGQGLLRRLGMGEDFIITAINSRVVHSPQDVVLLLQSASGKVVIEGVAKNGTKGYYSFYF